jgi:hypothetical protein
MARGLAVGAVLVVLGCQGGGGISDYERMKQGQQTAADGLSGGGAKLKQMNYPQGSAWSVNLSGMTITDDTLKQLKQLGKISELDLSKSTVTDDQLGQISDMGISTLLLKFNLSNTGITDAGFAKLENLAVLSQMNLSGTKVTPGAVDRFLRKRQTDGKVPPMFKNPNIILN